LSHNAPEECRKLPGRNSFVVKLLFSVVIFIDITAVFLILCFNVKPIEKADHDKGRSGIGGGIGNGNVDGPQP
jgi:hypothetical protein